MELPLAVTSVKGATFHIERLADDIKQRPDDGLRIASSRWDALPQRSTAAGGTSRTCPAKCYRRPRSADPNLPDTTDRFGEMNLISSWPNSELHHAAINRVATSERRHQPYPLGAY
jgi:hypothetical protein